MHKVWYETFSRKCLNIMCQQERPSVQVFQGSKHDLQEDPTELFQFRSVKVKTVINNIITCCINWSLAYSGDLSFNFILWKRLSILAQYVAGREEEVEKLQAFGSIKLNNSSRHRVVLIYPPFSPSVKLMAISFVLCL